jgi:Tfp pilus assembly protein PilP
MTKYIQILIIFLTLSACGQNTTEMKTPENANEKFAEFISKKKFIEQPYPNFYPGIADEKMRPIFTEKINQVATDFKTVKESKKPTDKKYQEKIGIGL